MTLFCGTIRVFSFVSFGSLGRICASPAHICWVVSSLTVWTGSVCFCIWFFTSLFFTLRTCLLCFRLSSLILSGFIQYRHIVCCCFEFSGWFFFDGYCCCGSCPRGSNYFSICYQLTYFSFMLYISNHLIVCTIRYVC